jgi:hypothetical protein
MTKSELEAEAVRAHEAGKPWSSFWATVGDEVRRLHPWDRAKYRRLYDRLLALHVAGNLDGHYPPGDDAPWEADDRAEYAAEVEKMKGKSEIQGTRSSRRSARETGNASASSEQATLRS